MNNWNVSGTNSFSPNQLTTLSLHMQVSIMTKAHFVRINEKKQPVILVLVSHKYSQKSNKSRIILRFDQNISWRSHQSISHSCEPVLQSTKKDILTQVLAKHIHSHLTSWLHYSWLQLSSTCKSQCWWYCIFYRNLWEKRAMTLVFSAIKTLGN